MRGKDPKLAKAPRPKIVVFGEAGVGKTWTALDWPDTYYIDCEAGASLPSYTDKLKRVGALYVGPEDGANDFGVVLQETQELATKKHDRKTLIIDSYSKLFGTAVQTENDRLTNSGKKTEFAVDKKPAVSATRRLITWLDKLDMNVILICHQKPVWQNGEQVGVTFDGWEKISYEFNLVLQIVKHGTARKAVVKKSRFPEFSEGELVPWSYEEFANRFGHELMESDSKPIQIASIEQVDEISQLAELFGMTDETKSKWLDKAGAESWGEMDSVTIQKCIDALKSKLPSLATA